MANLPVSFVTAQKRFFSSRHNTCGVSSKGHTHRVIALKTLAVDKAQKPQIIAFILNILNLRESFTFSDWRKLGETPSEQEFLVAIATQILTRYAQLVVTDRLYGAIRVGWHCRKC